jgi:acetyltransferase AlgX (SGNH hydrolase-like protein)
LSAIEVGRTILKKPLMTLLRAGLRGLAYTAYATGVTLVLLEGLFRLGVVKTPLYQERQAIHARLSDRPRVAILGDSFSIEGRDSVGTLLREHFASRGMDAINLAKMGEGPSYYLDRLALYGEIIRPQLVMVNYFAGNDLTDTLYELTPRGRRKQLIKRLMARSYSANQLVGLVQGFSLRRRLAHIEASPEYRRPGLEKLTNPFMLEISREHPDFLVQNLLLESQDAADAWRANEQVLSAIAERTRALGAELIVHVFPADVQVQRSHYGFYATLGIRTDSRFLTTSRPQEHLAEFCAAASLRCYDLLPTLRRASDRELYLEQDTHLNTEGNRVAFEQIRRNLYADLTLVSEPSRDRLRRLESQETDMR